MRRTHAMVLVLLVSMASLSARVAYAQPHSGTEALTVEALVQRALVENGELQAVRAEIDAAHGRLRQAGLRPNPMLDLSVQQSVTGPDNNLVIGVTVPLDLGGRKAGRVGVAEQALLHKQVQVANQERRVRADVRLKAGEILAAARNLHVTADLVAVNRHALDLLRTRVRQGAVPALDERLLLVEVHRLEASRTLLESQVEVLTLQAKTLAGLDPEVSLALTGDLRPVPVPFARDAGVAKALAARPDLHVARAEVAMADAGMRKERAEGRWDASVNVGYMRQDFGYDLRGLTERGDTQPIHDIFHYVGGGVTITLPLRNQNQGNIAAALAEIAAAKRRHAFLTLALRQEVLAAFTQHEAAVRALDIYTHGVREVARENVAVVRRAYELGRLSLLDLIAEQRRYLEVETGYTEALKQVYNAAVDVEHAVGALDR